ncbi:MAG: hypothetical protein AAF668_15535 [Pseudomonadota bacterium]
MSKLAIASTKRHEEGTAGRLSLWGVSEDGAHVAGSGRNWTPGRDMSVRSWYDACPE